MALKTVTYCKCPNGYADENAPLIRSSSIAIKLSDKYPPAGVDADANWTKEYWDKMTAESGNDGWVKIVCNEPITFNLDVNFKESAAATVAGKLNEIFNSKLIKALGGEMAANSLPTDSWTTEVVESLTPLTLNIKFRAFHHDLNKATCSVNPVDLIRFFILVSSSPIKYTGLGAVLNPAIGAARNAQSIVKHVKERYDEKKKQDKKGDNTESIKVVQFVTEQFIDEVAKSCKNARYNYTFCLADPVRGYKSGNHILQNNGGDWILKSWTANPSSEVKTNDNTPLWVDFDLTFESAATPSQEYLDKITTLGAKT